MGLLYIYDSSSWLFRQTAKRRVAEKKMPIADKSDLRYELDQLKNAGKYFDRILFDTHGSPGEISFDGKSIDRYYWDAMPPGRYNSLTAPSTKIYFNGCNVAEGRAGVEFLKAVVRVFMTTGDGEVSGQTSIGLLNLDKGQMVHYWGDTITIYVKDGKIAPTSEK